MDRFNFRNAYRFFSHVPYKHELDYDCIEAHIDVPKNDDIEISLDIVIDYLPTKTARCKMVKKMYALCKKYAPDMRLRHVDIAENIGTLFQLSAK